MDFFFSFSLEPAVLKRLPELESTLSDMRPVTTSEAQRLSGPQEGVPNLTISPFMGSGKYLRTHKPNRVSYQKPFLFQGQGPRLLFSGGYPILGPCAPGAVTTDRGAGLPLAILHRSRYRPFPRGLSRAADRLHPRAPTNKQRGTELRPGPDTRRRVCRSPPRHLPPAAPAARGAAQARGCAPPASGSRRGSLGIAAAAPGSAGSGLGRAPPARRGVLTPRSPWSRAGAGCPC